MTQTEFLVAGVDEAGRGPLAGPVVAAAVVLDRTRVIQGLDDSKRLSAGRRVALESQIIERALCWSVATATVEEIDRINILQATLLAMQRAVEGLATTPQRVLVDGNRCPALACPAQAVIGGDARIAAISAASILAKVSRDREMNRLHQLYPAYGFDRHKGYPTREHLAALRERGPSPVHRRSFRPVRERIAVARD
jgi:ribonuclease HII